MANAIVVNEIHIQTHRCNVDIRESCKTYWKDVYGWSGSLAVITAYGITTFSDTDQEDELSLEISVLNMYGSFAIGYVCWQGKVWQAFILEFVWFWIAVYSLFES